MTRVWLHRPRFWHLGLFVAAYVLGCGFAQALAIVPGTGISVWPPGGLFLATLTLARRSSWPWWMLAGLAAELFSNLIWFHSPLPAAVLMNAGNALEAALGAWLVNRTGRRPVRLETLQEVLAFVVLGAGTAPVAGATVCAATVASFGMQSQTFAAAWPLFWIGDATGILLVAPLALVALQDWREPSRFTTARWMEAAVLGLIFLGVAVVSLSGYLPFAYIIVPPLLWAAVRFEFTGAAVALTLLAIITAIFTIAGASQFAGDPESQRERQIMLQLFLAISAVSALIMAAISRQHHQALVTLRQSMETLRERERELSQLVNMVPVQIRRLTPEGEPTFFNKRLLDFFGLHDVAELDRPGMSRLAAAIGSLVHPDDSGRLLQTFRRSLASGEPFAMKYRMRRADGAYRWVDGRGEPVRDQNGAIAHWYAISIDIEDEMRAQEELRERERELSLLVNMVPSYLWRMTPDGVSVFFNQRFVDFLGLDVAEVDKPGRSRLAALIEATSHPDDAASVVEAFDRCLASGERLSMKWRMRRADGVFRWMAASAEAMRDQKGGIVQWYGLCHDVDDQVERERSLWQLVETLPVMIDCAAPDGEPMYRSRQLREFLGYELNELDGTGKSRLAGTLDAGVHPDDVAGVKQQYAHALTTGEPYARRHRLRRFDGEYIWVDTRAAPMRDAAGTIAQWNVICLDIDAEVRAQEDLRLAQERLARAGQAASLAELSASIAHEVNQPLAAIVAHSHACHRWLSAEPPNVERAKITAERIARDANSAANVVSRVRALFSHAPHRRTPEDVNRVIGEVCRLMADEIAATDICIQMSLEHDLPCLAFDRVQVQQVIVNLIRNGIEAMGDVGSDAPPLEIRSRRDGADAIRIEVRDAGAGFTEATRALEPFFTTKKNGMGMGLAICRSIVESHGGRLWTVNNEPRGATVAFTLPLAASAAP